MKKIFLFLVAATLLVSCNSEMEVKPDTEGSATMLTFSIGLPMGDPVTYAIQTKQERLVRRFDIYQFAEGETGALEATYYNQPLSATSTGYTVSVGINGTGNKQFFFVANNEGENPGGNLALVTLTPGSTTADAFQKELTKTLAANTSLKSPLLMTAHIPVVNVLESNTPAQTVELVRIMSRLDIKNYEPRLTINRVRLERVLDRSFIFHQAGVSQNPAGAQVITLPEAILPTTPTPVDGNDPIEMEQVAASGGFLAHTHYKHVFYPYVSDEVAEENEAPLIIIEGTLFKDDPDREAKVIYKKALKVTGQTNFLGFARNTRYTLVIEKAIPDELTSTLKVDMWNEDVVNADIQVIAPVTTSFYQGFRYDGFATLTEAGSVLTVKKDFTAAIEVSVNSNTEWEVYPEGSSTVPEDGQMNAWLTALPFSSYWGGTVPQNTLKDALRLRLTVNNTGAERTQRVVLRSKADNDKQSVLTVKQLP